MIRVNRAIVAWSIIETEQIHLIDALEDAVADDFAYLTRPFFRLRHIKDELCPHSSSFWVVARVDVHIFA
jgi:hypothetical protein